MSLFKGAGVALITPFNEDNSVNYEMLRTLVRRQIDGGTDAIIVCGTTGEPATMTEEEKLSVIKCVVDETAGQIPVIAGTGANCTQNVIDFSQKVEKLGVDGLLVVTPYYNKATQNGLYAHYAAIAGAVGLPIIMYNVPSRTGCNILPQTAARLGRDFENIVGIKEASGNISQVAKLKKLAGNDLDIYSGNDDQTLPILSLGGIGLISVLSNIAPKFTCNMVHDFLNGNIDKATSAQLRSIDLINSLFCEVNPIPVKAALNMIGYNFGSPRLPLIDISEKGKQRLKKSLENFNLL